MSQRPVERSLPQQRRAERLRLGLDAQPGRARWSVDYIAQHLRDGSLELGRLGRDKTRLHVHGVVRTAAVDDAVSPSHRTRDRDPDAAASFGHEAKRVFQHARDERLVDLSCARRDAREEAEPQPHGDERLGEAAASHRLIDPHATQRAAAANSSGRRVAIIRGTCSSGRPIL
eukprot:2417616-Prymnesium_polylepis.1